MFDTRDRGHVGKSQLLFTFPRRCSLLFHSDVNETFYCSSDVGHDRTLRERESSWSIFKRLNLFYILERVEERRRRRRGWIEKRSTFATVT